MFDVLDTLVVDPFHEALPAFFGLSFDEFVQLKHPTAWLDFECARLDEADYLATLFLDRRPVDGDALRAHLSHAYRWVDGMEALLAEVAEHGRAAGFEVHALSNYGAWYRLIEHELGLSRFLRWSFVSWDTGHRKPDAAAYQQVERHLDATGAQLFFVDDQTRNVEAAVARGWDAVRFTAAEELRGELARRDLVASADPGLRT